MEYAIVTAPVAAIRKKPGHRKEMTNQLLFGESVRILKIKNKRWLKVESLFDGYVGWLTHHLITRVEKAEAKETAKNLTADPLSEILYNNEKMLLPMGSFLPGFENGNGTIGQNAFKYSGNSLTLTGLENEQSPGDKIEALALKWCNAPYLWGGKTILGVDCSGFAQTVFKLAGIPILRDAWQQAQQGQRIKKLIHAQKGDLAFFDDADEIVHVGILLSPNHIIHASGKVRIDKIDQQGIIHTETQKRTHQLRVIRRFF